MIFIVITTILWRVFFMVKLRDYETAAKRREVLEKNLNIELSAIGNFSFDESIASTKNCENMIGATQIPLGVAGPLLIQQSDKKVHSYYLPLATTEGALIASISRGCKAIAES